MATKYAEFPVEETDKFIYGVAPAQGPAQAPTPVQTQPLAPGPVAPTAPPTAPVAKTPNASNLVKKVAEANKQLQEQMPAPEPQSATQNLVGDITKNWQSLLPLAGIPAIAWLANKAFGGESESGGKPKEPPKSIADRSIRKAEPLMDVNQKPPTGPVEPEFAKPAPSVVKVSRDPIEQRLFEISQAQQATKIQPPMMGQPAPVAPPLFNLMGQPLDKAFAEFVPPPSVESIDKARAASIASPAVQPTVAPVAEAVAPPQEAPKPPAKAPAKPKVAMPEGWGKGMSWLVNQYGVTGAKDFIDVHNKGNPYTSYDDFMAKYKSVMVKPSYSDIPKGVRKERGIIPREEMKAVVPPPSGGGFVAGPGGVGNLRSSSGGDIHKLNPSKLME
jgi:hypothetical protein